MGDSLVDTQSTPYVQKSRSKFLGKLLSQLMILDSSLPRWAVSVAGYNMVLQYERSPVTWDLHETIH